jgi:hypothetical protein
MPDWNSLIANSPYVVAAEALAHAQLAALKSQMGASAARALINLGDVGVANQVSGITLPGNTAGLVSEANKAGTSILSQLGYRHGQQQAAIPARLAGAGFYRSGETGYLLGQEARQYGQQQYQARSSTLDYLNNLYNQYLSAQFGIQQGELSARMQAYQSALANISAYLPAGGPLPSEVTTAPAPSPITAPYGYDYQGRPIDLSRVGYGSFLNP